MADRAKLTNDLAVRSSTTASLKGVLAGLGAFAVANLHAAHYERLVVCSLALSSGLATDPNLVQLHRVDAANLVSIGTNHTRA